MNTSFTEKDIFERGVSEIIEKDSLEKRLESSRGLRVKFGIDPTAPDMHLGHTAPLWKLRQFQEQGHTAVLIIGDYTASIGDPAGKDKTRPPLTPEDIQENYKTYEEQALKIVSSDNLEVHLQSEWFKDMSIRDFIKLTSQVSVGHLLSHETFKDRIENEKPFATHELLYPFLQGYDSVAVEADVEIGASEQKFNLLMGRIIQKQYDMEPQEVITMEYLLGTDGKNKMSKSLNNYIAVQDEPNDMFGKVMSITDSEIALYFELATPVEFERVQEIKGGELSGEQARDKKLELAELITSVYWGEDKAQKAKKRFLEQFQKQEIPEDVDEVSVRSGADIVSVLTQAGLAPSKSEARRLIDQGGVYIDDDKVTDYSEVIPKKEFTLRVGRRKIIKVSPE